LKTDKREAMNEWEKAVAGVLHGPRCFVTYGATVKVCTCDRDARIARGIEAALARTLFGTRPHAEIHRAAALAAFREAT